MLGHQGEVHVGHTLKDRRSDNEYQKPGDVKVSSTIYTDRVSYNPLSFNNHCTHEKSHYS